MYENGKMRLKLFKRDIKENDGEGEFNHDIF
jgi:hypothetical protein